MKLKKISLTADYLNALANANLGTYHYKVLLLLETKAMTQAQVSEILKIKKQNINFKSHEFFFTAGKSGSDGICGYTICRKKIVIFVEMRLKEKEICCIVECGISKNNKERWHFLCL